MAKRKFSLPRNLTKEQDKLLLTLNQGQYLIIGGPGTGKSVVALRRSRKYQEEKVNYVFLFYFVIADINSF